LAAIASVPVCEREWLRAHKTNIGATVALMEAVGHAQRAHQKKIPFIYASSAAVYGVNNDGRLSEDRMVKPFSAYGADKYACELHAAVGARNHNITSVGLRFFNVFGAGQDPSSPYSGVISIFMARLKQQQPLTIFGDGTAARDYIPVEKIVEGIMASLALARAQPEAQSHVFNLCTGQATTAKELADMLSTISGQNSAIDFAPPRAGDVPRSVGDPSAMASVLGVNPAIDLRAALSALWKTV
ncbi:MAG: NAD-dependent epimerase/dehydratase family protein, partial [Alphaproteobacteria bacterium]|nr:NAD-dependent epimerase/dehydratase family protein [Alphaproteobacteria bacterium]